MRRNIEISVNFERGPYINAHAQNIDRVRMLKSFLGNEELKSRILAS